MILDFLPTPNEDIYEGVPENTKFQRMDITISLPSILIARTADDIRRCLGTKRYRTGIKAIVLMTNDGPEAWNTIETDGLVLIIGQQLGLPEGIKYTGVTIGNRKNIWGENQIIQRGDRYFLTPQFVQREAAFKLQIAPELPIGEISHNRNVRSQVLGNLGAPRDMRLYRTVTGTGIDEATIVVNPK